MLDRIRGRLRRFWKRIFDRFLRSTYRFSYSLHSTDDILSFLAFFAAVGFIGGVVAEIGFSKEQLSTFQLIKYLKGVQTIFVLKIISDLLINIKNRFSKLRKGMIILDIGVFLTLIPVLISKPSHRYLEILTDILYSNIFIYSVLGIYSIICISDGIMRLVGKRTNPSLMLSGSFIVFILLGSLLLMMPKCTYSGISYINALFISTSAVCITGLTPVDVSTTFTPLGLSILALLIQIGGLGVLTFTSFFALFFTGKSSIFNQLMLKDVIYSKSMSALIPSLIYTLLFTLGVELIGAVAIFLAIHNRLALDLPDELIFSAFHSLSSFCNAGFSNISQGLSNPNLLYGNQIIYWIVSVLIVSGSIGFPLLVNFKEAITKFFRRHWLIFLGKNPGNRQSHYYSMNSKIVITTFSALFVFGAILFFFFEYNNTLRGMTIWQKISQSVFNSVVPRSAGFSSVNPASFLNTTLIVIMFLMWIGGGSQSTGGGIKVNTFAAIILNLRAYIMGKGSVTAFKRTVALPSIRRANAVVALSILTYFLFSLIIIQLEPHMSVRQLLFETLSAVFTVGSSLGATPYLSVSSKVILCFAMFLGRIGMISLLIGIKGRETDNRIHYPDDSIIIT